MATGIAQKSCTALFPLRSLRKNDVLKILKKIRRGTAGSIERNLNIKIEKK